MNKNRIAKLESLVFNLKEKKSFGDLNQFYKDADTCTILQGFYNNAKSWIDEQKQIRDRA